jgi:hypothetical protein
MWLLRQPEQFQLQNAMTALPNILGELSVAIWWTRFVLAARLPKHWIDIPGGNARYFSRELIVGFGTIVGIIPGFLLARIVSPQFPNEGILGAGALILANAVVVLYVCARFWLVFPAIAMRDDQIGFAQSFRTTRRAAIGLLIGTVLVYFAFLAPAVLIDSAQDYIAPEGVVASSIAVGTDVLTSLLYLAAVAAGAGLSALAYQQLVASPPSVEETA